jgi:RimJ/RimL family protein N-acetyltransferase
VLRNVEPEDIEIFYTQEADPVANAMAAFPARDRTAHAAHWQKVLAHDSNVARTIVEQGQVVGYIGSWAADGQRLVGYWIGRDHWGRGIATRALADFVAEITERPLHACVAEHNRASIRVLVKCGFDIVGTHQPSGEPIREILLRLDAP